MAESAGLGGDHLGSFFFLITSFILVVLGLRCCTGFSLVVVSGCHSPAAVCRPLMAAASPAVEHRLWVHGFQ